MSAPSPARVAALDRLARQAGRFPDLEVVDMGVAAGLSTTTLQKDIYAFFFNQKGLMAGISLQGTKVTPYTPSE